jgi:hypothetical protein
VLFFHQLIFGGKIILAQDDIGPQSFSTLINDAREAGIFPLWNPYIFCGMPAYGSLMLTGDRTFDLSSWLVERISGAMSFLLMNPQNGWQMFYYMIMAIGMYLLVYHRLRMKVPALIAAIATVFSSHIIIWIMIGHGTKILVMTAFPYVVLFVDRLRERFSLLDLLLLTLALHFALIGGHVQMIFYTFLFVGGYYVFFFVRDLLRKESVKGTLRSALLFAAAGVVAFLMVSDRYLSVLEYNPYSMRGSPPILAELSTSDQTSPSGGLDYDYATNWSLSPGEMMTFLVPSWYGFGWHTYDGPLTNNQPTRLNTYVGPQPFTDVAPYLGVVVLALAVLGLVKNRKDPFVVFLGIVSLFALLVAFGKEFPLLYDPMFSYFPFFNKFRVPSMILVLMYVAVPILAAYGIVAMVRERDTPLSPRQLQRWRIALGALVAAAILSFIGRGFVRDVYAMFFSREFLTERLARSYGNQPPAVMDELIRFITSSVTTDISLGLLFLIAAFGALWLYRRGKLSYVLAAVILTGVILADLWRVSSKPMETERKDRKEQIFAKPQYVDYLLQDPSTFRVLEFINGQPPYSNMLAYWRIQSAYGYQGAKMRWYQDMVDVGGIGNPLVWKLMNVKYIITNRPDSSTGLQLVYNGIDRKIHLFGGYLPRAFFVNGYDVASGLDILRKIRSQEFNPRERAYFLDDPGLQLDVPAPSAHADITHYGLQEMSLDVVATGTNLLHLSDAYYPEGWKAYLDEKEIPIYRVNYLFRGLVIPAGAHKLELRFEPRGFAVGKMLSLLTNIMLLGAFAFLVVQAVRKRSSPT